MFELEFYEDEHGYSDVRDFIDELEAKTETSKDARINRNKVVAYPEQVVRKLEDWIRRH